ncbi:hypothetical protein EV183_000783 [Coemansia sp. RSA 2336]|nr:hypothetical protein EV183_000783 [Coemansia sp. RSA 2336]
MHSWRALQTVRNGSLRIFARAHSHKAASTTAAFCVIGDEILNGKVHDQNTFVLANRCFELGIELRKIEVVPDTPQAIVDSLRQLSSSHSMVITSGGIGPTHDDITYDAVARAAGVNLQYHEPTLQRMRRIMVKRNIKTLPDPQGTDEEKACARMALLPCPAQIVYPCDQLWVPVVNVDKIHVFPGIPKLFDMLLTPYMLQLMQQMGQGKAFVRELITTQLRESVIAPILDRLQKKYAPQQIKLGSYPDWTPENKHTRVVVSIVGQDKAPVEACRSELLEQIPDSFM